MIAAAIVVVVGLAIARWLHPSAHGGRLAGEAILLGLAGPAILLLALSLLGVRWSPALLIGTSLGLAIACLVASARRKDGYPGMSNPPSVSPGTALSIVTDLVTLLVVVGYLRFAWVASGAENDFIGIWGVKAWTFLESGGIDWGFLQAPGNAPSHPDYPLLLPAIFSWVALVAGGWNEQLVGLVHPALGLGVLLVVRHALRRESGSPVMASLATLALAPAALSPWIGLGEGPMIAFGTAGLLLARESLEEGNGAGAPAAVFLGLAASTKNEGLTLLAAAAVCFAIFSSGRRWRGLLGLWPAAAIAVPWVILRNLAGLPSDFARGAFFVRLVERLTDAGRLREIARLLIRTPIAEPWFWLVAIAALVIGWPAARRADGFVLAAVAAQAGFFVAAYVMSPFPLEWHIVWSWERVVSQILLPFAVVATCLLMRILANGESKT